MSFIFRTLSSWLGYTNAEPETKADVESEPIVIQDTKQTESTPNEPIIEQTESDIIKQPQTEEKVIEDQPKNEENEVIDEQPKQITPEEQLEVYKSQGIKVNHDNNCLQIPYVLKDSAMEIAKFYETNYCTSRLEFIMTDEERNEYNQLKNEYRQQGVVTHNFGGKKCKRIQMIEVPKTLESSAEKLKYFFCSSSYEIKND
jgi:hypothetical protein